MRGEWSTVMETSIPALSIRGIREIRGQNNGHFQDEPFRIPWGHLQVVGLPIPGSKLRLELRHGPHRPDPLHQPAQQRILQHSPRDPFCPIVGRRVRPCLLSCSA